MYNYNITNKYYYKKQIYFINESPISKNSPAKKTRKKWISLVMMTYIKSIIYRIMFANIKNYKIIKQNFYSFRINGHISCIIIHTVQPGKTMDTKYMFHNPNFSNLLKSERLSQWVHPYVVIFTFTRIKHKTKQDSHQ